MVLSNWFITYLLPIFVDLSVLEEKYCLDIPVTDWLYGGITIFFAVVLTVLTVNFLLILPARWLLYLLRGGRKKKV